MSNTPSAITLYRAEGIPHVLPKLPLGVTPRDVTASWTSSEAAARFYCERHDGERVISRTVASPAVLDLRSDPAAGLDAAGLDWDDYDRRPLYDLCRDLAPVLRSLGYQWVAFYSGTPDPRWDEWLELGEACTR